MALMDQQSDIRQHMNMYRMVTTDPGKMSSDGKRRVDSLSRRKLDQTTHSGLYTPNGFHCGDDGE